ncbi:MAG: hypothetical protein E7254_00055 [Lachnospiraceae bacterium]|nr:hypothetical protein [Lachnospiraceae bacterium]
MDELMKGVKLGKALSKDEKKSDTIKILAIAIALLSALVAVSGIAYAIYLKKTDDYYDDFEDDFDDLFDEDDDESDGEEDIFAE